ncbi:MAG: acyl-CoA dehydrogenase family protein [Deltaproteobacteria bacterium]|nr:acyl-CoA dehydrogenase family protein [Deltaproteobacteria bacterium]
MNFDLTPEQEMLRRTVREFAEREIAPRMQELDEREEFSPELTRAMGDLGLFGMTVSPDYGGHGLDYLSYIIAVEEIARVNGSQAATVAAENSLGIGPLYYFGTEEQKRRYLPDLCAGRTLWGFGLTEPSAGSDAGGSKTTARLEGDRWIINGSKIFITNAGSPMTAGSTVQCVTGTRPDGSKEVTCIIVEQDTPGFTTRTMHKKMVWRASNTAELYFDNVSVPRENLLGTRGQGFRQMLETLDSGRLSIAAMGLGGAQGAFEAAITYARERRQFGKPISQFQANAFKLADMAMEIETARNLLYKACWLRDQSRPFRKEAAMAKLWASEVMRRVTHASVQIFGGYGLMEEYPVARFYRDQRLLEIGEGTSEVQRLVISRILGCYE